MNEYDTDEAQIRALRERFETGLDSVNEFDRARLRRARRQALSQVPAGGSSGRLARWRLPAAMAAAMALVAVLLVPNLPLPGDESMEGSVQVAEEPISDLEILLAEDELSLYAELDFYVWLEAELADREARDAG